MNGNSTLVPRQGTTNAHKLWDDKECVWGTEKRLVRTEKRVIVWDQHR